MRLVISSLHGQKNNSKNSVGARPPLNTEQRGFHLRATNNHILTAHAGESSVLVAP